MKFSIAHLDEDLYNQQDVITVKFPDTISEFEVIKLVPKNKRHTITTDTLDMEVVAGSLLKIINIYQKAGMLTAISYDDILIPFKPFIDKYRSFEDIEKLKGVNKF